MEHLQKDFQILSAKFGFEFKKEQKQVVSALLNGQDVSAIFPTGYGKTVCYICPAPADKRSTSM